MSLPWPSTSHFRYGMMRGWWGGYEQETAMVNIIQQPAPFDLVGDPVLIAGIGQGFEATLNWRVHDGHD